MATKILSTNMEYDSENEKPDDVARLHLETQKIIDALTAPAYVAALRAVKDAPIDKRLLEASNRLTPDALRKQGVPIPEGMRISSRYFEKGLPASINFGDLPDGSPNPLNALNESNPGLLDKLRSSNKEAFASLISNETTKGDDKLVLAAFGGCHCGGIGIIGPLGIGHGTACGGAGFQL
jgi:hypothetical protein